MAKYRMPFKGVLPPLSADEQERLKADIKANGVKSPIEVTEDDTLLDGHHRYGIDPKAPVYVVPGSGAWTEDERLAYAIRANLSRRQLSPAQEQALQRETLIPLANRLKWGDYEAAKKIARSGGRPKPQKSEDKIAQLLGRSRATINAWTIIPVASTGNRNNSRATAPAPPKTKPTLAKVSTKIPAAQHAEVVKAVQSGKTQAAVAAEYKVGQAAISKIVAKATKQEAEREERAKATKAAEHPPTVEVASWDYWLPEQEDCDLLLTDPPYSTDVDDIFTFAAEWLPVALDKVKTTGRAYVFIGAYPDELAAYLGVEPPPHMSLENILVWTYENTLGPSPSHKYKLNWQAILYYQGTRAGPLNCPKMTEQFSVHKVNAPDGRLGDRYHAWQKPDALAERLIAHSTNPGALVLDPFVCTGTFVIAAAKLKRIGRGCDISRKHLKIAKDRGCLLRNGSGT